MANANGDDTVRNGIAVTMQFLLIICARNDI
jgi:hypothetical protein